MNTTTMTKMLKTACLAAILAGGVASVSAQIALPWHEPFPLTYTNAEAGASTETTYYPQGGPNYPSVRIGTGNTLTIWSIGGGQGNGSPLVVGPAGLSYPGLGDPNAPVSAGLYVRTNNTTGNRQRGAVFTPQTGGTVYSSFLLNSETLPLDRRLVVFLSSQNSGTLTGGPLGVWIEADGKLSLTKSANSANAGVVQPTPLATTTSSLSAGTHLVVVRYTFNPGSDDDEVALWLDPAANTLGVSEGNVPAATLSGTTGTDAATVTSFWVFHPSQELTNSFILDEVRVGLTWADVTPSGAVCNSAFVSTDPVDATVVEGLSASLTAVFGGTSPTYQWQVSTDGGTVWNDVSGGIGINGPTYLTPPNTLASSGHKYRAIGTVACNNSSATSAVATVTVTPAVAATNGVYLDDVFADFQYNNIPIDSSNSVWLQSVSGTLDASLGTHLTATSQAGSVTWLGFLTDDSQVNQPIHLPVGKALKVTLVFKGNNITASAGNFRIGLFDYADGGVRPTFDGSGVQNSGLGVRGYMVALNYGLNFSANPYSLYVRNSLVTDLMGTTGNYIGLGGGPTGYAGAQAFQNGVAYTAVFTVSRTGDSSVTFDVNITGGGTNWTHSRVDNDYAYPRFDSIGIRSAGAALAADSFEISRLLVEVVSAAPTPENLNISAGSGNITLTWSNPAFTLQAAPNVTGTYTNVTGATSPYVVPASGAARFFRLTWP